MRNRIARQPVLRSGRALMNPSDDGVHQSYEVRRETDHGKLRNERAQNRRNFHLRLYAQQNGKQPQGGLVTRECDRGDQWETCDRVGGRGNVWGLSNGIVGGVGGPEPKDACRTRTADPNYAKPFPTWSRQRGLSNECSNT